MKDIDVEKLKATFSKSINKDINNTEAFAQKIIKDVGIAVPGIEEELSINEIQVRLKELQLGSMKLVRAEG